MRRIKAALLIMASTFYSITSASADFVAYDGTLEITQTDNAGDVALSDLFHFSLTYDDQIQDTEVSGFSGIFPGAIINFTLQADPGNTGSWNPSTGTWSLPGLIQTQETQGRFRAQPSGTGFPQLAGINFFGLDMAFQAPVTDNGVGETLQQQIGGSLGDVYTGADVFFKNSNGGDSAEAVVISLTAVPEPSACLYLGAVFSGSLAGCLLTKRCRQTTRV